MMKLDLTIHREFEIPYQFEPKLITGLQILNIPEKYINCFYMAPYFSDYETIVRSSASNKMLLNISKQEYIRQIEYINSIYPNKLQLLLQRTNNADVLTNEKLQFYYQIGFRKFCVGSIKQAEILKNNNNNIEIVGSITMHISKDKLETNDEYQKYFDSFVLDFSYPKNLEKIKALPTKYKYIILVNSLCNKLCTGDKHWWTKEECICPGLIKNVGFQQSCLIRPMDLHFFDDYIKNDKLPFNKLIVFSIQLMLSVFVATCLIAQICGVAVSGALVGAGLSTIIYLIITGFKSPMFVSSSGAFVAPVMAALAMADILQLQLVVQ